MTRAWIRADGVEHGGERVGGGHLALHRVEAGLQAGGVRVGVGDLDERLGALDDVLGLQRGGDVGGGLAGLDLDDDLALARAGVVGRARGREGVLQLADAAQGEVARRRRGRPTTSTRARTTASPPCRGLLAPAAAAAERASSSDHTDRSVMSRLSRRPAPPSSTRTFGAAGSSPRVRALDEPAWCHAGRPLGVQRALQDDDSSGLVDDAAAPARVYPARLQPTLRTDRGEPLVDQPDRHRRAGRPAVQRTPRRPRRPGRAARTATSAGPTTTSTASRSATSSASAVQVAAAAAQRLDRGREQAGGVAGGHPDPDRADVDADPHAGPHGRAIRLTRCR